MKKYCLIIALLTCSSVCFANSSFSENSLSGLIIHDSGELIVLQLSAPSGSGEGCTNNSELVLYKNHLLFNEMYAAILSSFHSNTTFKGWVNGCHAPWGMPILVRIDLVK